MLNTVEWLIANQVLLVTYKGEQNYDTTYCTLEKIYNMMADSPEEKIHVISDLQYIETQASLSDNVRVMRELKDRDKQGGMAITVGNNNALLSLIMKISKNLFRHGAEEANTVEDAIMKLKAAKPNLNWDNLDHRLTS